MSANQAEVPVQEMGKMKIKKEKNLQVLQLKVEDRWKWAQPLDTLLTVSKCLMNWRPSMTPMSPLNHVSHLCHFPDGRQMDATVWETTPRKLPKWLAIRGWSFVIAKVNGELFDTTRPLEVTAPQLLDFDREEGRAVFGIPLRTSSGKPVKSITAVICAWVRPLTTVVSTTKMGNDRALVNPESQADYPALNTSPRTLSRRSSPFLNV